MSILENFSSEEINTEGDFTIITSDKDRSLQGNIYLNTGELVSSTFRNSSEIYYTNDQDLLNLTEGKEHKITPCYEGAVVKVWIDSDKKPHLSSTKKIDCRSSFWGNKEDNFEKLFMENGGLEFMKTLDFENTGNLTHHFMLMNRSNLVITTRIDMRDNENIVVYLGSVDLEGNILEVSNVDPSVYHYHSDRTNALPSKEELKSRILIPTAITLRDASIILNNGYDGDNYEEKEIPHKIFKGEPVVIKRSNGELIKVLPENYDMRKHIAGNTPNVKNRLYTLLEAAKDQSTYSDNFHILGCLSEDQLETIFTQDSSHSSFIINAFINKEKRFDMTSIEDRMSNILTNCLLFCPLHKVNIFIEAWRDYKQCRDLILKFLKRHNHDIRHGKYDEKLTLKRHESALKRIKNLAEISKIYASEKGSQYSYSSRMEFSLKGALKKEFGPSLYRIEKAIRFLQE